MILTAHYWHTPTTSASVVNDTTSEYSLGNCEDYLVSLAPHRSAEVEPFVDQHDGCTVYRGTSNLGSPVGCLVFPASGGSVVAGSRVKLSAMMPYSSRWCSQ